MKIHGANTVAAAGARVALRSFGLELRHARIPAGLRQEDVAAELGVSTQTVRNWESGRVEPSEENKRRLGELLGEQLGDFASFYEESHSYNPKRKKPILNGRLLREARREEGFTQAEAAERIGVNRNTVLRYENGASRPSREILEKLSRLYVKSPDWFYSDGYAPHSTTAGEHAATPAGRARTSLELAISEMTDEEIAKLPSRIGLTRFLYRAANAKPG